MEHHPESSDASAEEHGIPSLPVRIVQVFVSPAKLFDDLRHRPAWLGAILGLIGLSIALQLLMPVVVPEYDRVAPVLTKPVLPGLHGLAQGSLLKSFALTVGIGRIAEDPVARAIDVLLAGDTDGRVRVRAALSLWPLSLRRRISARFWRAERDERDRQVAEKAAKRRQSHKYRRVQSHQDRYRIS